MKTLVEIHVLQNFAPSNLNRDDTGAPKDAFFGGCRRARISSQCIKNAVRKYFSSAKLLEENEMAIRTKRLLGEIVKKLVELGRNENEAREKTICAINSLGFKFKDNEKTQYLIFLGRVEINNLAVLINEKWEEIGSPKGRLSILKDSIQQELFPPPNEVPKDKFNAVLTALGIAGNDDKIGEDKITAVENCFDEIIALLKENVNEIKPAVDEDGKAIKRKKNEKADWENKLADILKEGKKGLSPMGKALQKIMDGGKAVDLALFGRMLADMPEKNQNAACQVAHAISTNAVNREFDFFTALDELKPDETAASDMMGDIEFTSACFYRYAVLDYQKLIENLQGDDALAQKGIRAFLEGFIISEPTGKQNSFAAHNTPEFIVINVRHDSTPRNLSNAFERPVRVNQSESLTMASAIKLGAKAAALDTLLGTTLDKSKYVCSEDTFGTDFKLAGVGEKEISTKNLIEWAISELNKKGE